MPPNSFLSISGMLPFTNPYIHLPIYFTFAIQVQSPSWLILTDGFNCFRILMLLQSEEFGNKMAARPKPDSPADLDKVVHFCASNHSN